MSSSGIGERGAHHVGVEVAFAAEPAVGVELRHRHVEAREPVRVEAALHVALEHGDADLVQPAHDPFQQRRLARAGRTHQVDDRDTRAVEVVAVGPRDRVVGVESVLDDLDLGPMHTASYIALTLRYRLISGISSATPATITATSARKRAS